MPAYDDFAWFYDRYWNEEFHSLAFPILERIWLPRVKKGGRILDVCCGTGYLAALLGDRGYRVTGVDESAEMIEHARRSAPAAEFVVAGAADFHLRRQFDAAASTFDSVNHLVADGELAGMFRCTVAVLKRGAAFVFDVLLAPAYRTTFGQDFSIVRRDHSLTITDAAYDFRTRRAQCTITMFRLIDGAWRRSDAVIHQRCYTMDEIEAALTGAGLGEIECYDAGDLGMAGELGEGRTFVVARML